MKVACVDRTAADRLELQKFFEDALCEARDTVGHVNLTETYPSTAEDLLFSSDVEAIAIGHHFTPDDIIVICKRLKEKFPNSPILVFLSEANYELRMLRRLQEFNAEIFSTAENSTRLVHTLTSIDFSIKNSNLGSLIVINGVKGGIGATTVTGGFAHAAHALGKSQVVIDLSPTASFLHYMQSSKSHSPELAEAIRNKQLPDSSLIERSVVTAPNGVEILLVPSGGMEIRDKWIRDPESFEFTLNAIEILKESYDIVLIDTAHSEGVLPFAVNSRADARILLTGNDPASVHLLTSAMEELTDLPGSTQTKILINCCDPASLSASEVIDFISLYESYDEEMVTLPNIPYDSSGHHWIGTGNTFYTESSTKTQQHLETTLDIIIGADLETAKQLESDSSFSGKFKDALSRFKSVKKTSSKLINKKEANEQLEDLAKKDNTQQEVFVPIAEKEKQVLNVDKLEKTVILKEKFSEQQIPKQEIPRQGKEDLTVKSNIDKPKAQTETFQSPSEIIKTGV